MLLGDGREVPALPYLIGDNMNDDIKTDYPAPECPFGIAIGRDLKHIKKELGEIKDKQDEHTETLQNGLSSEVNQVKDDVQELKEEKETEEEQRRKWRRTVITRVLEAGLTLGIGFLLGWLGFS